MIVGVPRETAAGEHRVALDPAGARELVGLGHRVLVEQGAGAAAGLLDDAWIGAGAEIVSTGEDVWSRAELVCKVEAPGPAELEHVRPGQLVCGFLHLPARPDLARALEARGAVPVPWEDLGAGGVRPVLRAMSEIAGRLAVLVGARLLLTHEGGRGVLLGGAPGVPPAQVLVLGAGSAGANAAATAVGTGAQVTLVDRDLDALRRAEDRWRGRVGTLALTASGLEDALAHADLVVGAAHVPGERAPRLLDRGHLALMRPGAVLVDVSVPAGGVAETTVPTEPGAPARVVDNVVHVGVPNLPGTVPRTATPALARAARPFVLALAGGADPTSLRA